MAVNVRIRRKNVTITATDGSTVSDITVGDETYLSNRGKVVGSRPWKMWILQGVLAPIVAAAAFYACQFL